MWNRKLVVCTFLFLLSASAQAAGSIDAAGVTPASVLAGVATSVTFTANISDSSVNASSVNLQQLNGSGQATVIGVLYDDGTHGDATAGDGTYTLQFSLFQQAPGTQTYRVSAGFQGSLTRVFSAPIAVTITGSGTAISITSPSQAAYLSISPALVTGTVSDPQATVTVNGIAAQVSGSGFSASVPLREGSNLITAVAQNTNGMTSTAAETITLDTTPPHVTINAPADGSTTSDASVDVSGIVNDIVVGTVNAQQASVNVSGIQADVGNRSYLAMNVPLQIGSNTITATARDRAGNFVSVNVVVTRTPPSGQSTLRIVSGNGLSGPIQSLLPAPLAVQVLDPSGQSVANTPVVFQVVNGDGKLSSGSSPGRGSVVVNTDGQGQARVNYTLGSRAGSGNNQVKASATGITATPIFTESATTASPAMIVVDSGGNQSGVVSQALPLPFIAIVTDSGHNRLPNVPVTFTVTQGGGSFGGQPILQSTTDSDGRAQAVLTLGPQAGINNNIVAASFTGVEGLPASFTATSYIPGPASNTSISGVVLDNSGVAIPGATVRLYQVNNGGTGVPQQVVPSVQTNTQGTFSIRPAPVGVYKLMIDGTTATRAGPFPTLEYDLVTVPGQDNTVGLPIYLPQLMPGNQLCVTATTGGTLTIPQAPGFALNIAPGSATFPGGSKTGCVSVTPVNMDKVPMVPGFGQQPRFIVTIQPVGTTFNPPAQITIPNVDGLAPRAVTEMYSYDHDLASFVAIGTGTVSADGSVIASDPGVGVLKAGWHCGGDPNASGSSGALAVSLTPPVQTTMSGNTVNVTANGTPPLDGTYSWQLIDDSADPNDDPAVGTFVSQPNCTGASSCVAKIKGIKSGRVTVQVTFKCTTTGATVTATAKINSPADLTITEVDFQGANKITLFKDKAGSAPAAIASPEWVDANLDGSPETDERAAYVGSKPGANKISLIAKFTAKAPCPSDVSNIKIKGDTGSGLHFVAGAPAISGCTVSIPTTASTENLPATTKFYNPLTITWQYSTDGGATYNNAGSSSHKTYVTLAQPTQTAYLTSVHLAVSLDGATNNVEAINKSWSLFGTGTAPADVKGWDNRPFIYYPAGTKFSGCATNLVDLLTTATGGARCGAFALFFQNVLAMNGIASVDTTVDPAEDDAMLVKNWGFSGTPSFPAAPSYKWLFKTVGFNEMVPAPAGGYGDMTNNSGVAGENSPTPSEKAHINHAIVKAPDTGLYYDPSYGLTYTGPNDFEDKALDGYIFHVPGEPNTDYHVRKSTGLHKATFTP